VSQEHKVLGWARPYRPAWLRHDIAAGLVLTTLLVPQGMAYAELAGLPPITGLYTSIICLLAYAAVGPNRILVLGPDSALGPVIFAAIIPLVGADGDPAKAIVLASMLSILVGLILLLAGFLRLGLIADLLSRPTQIGYMNGLAVTIFIGQLPKMLGFSTDARGFLEEVQGIVNGVLNGEILWATFLVGLGSFIVIMAFKRWLPKLPGILFAVVGAIVVSMVIGLADTGATVVGVLPQGFPPLTIPFVGLDDIAMLLGGALGIALVGLTDTISVSTAFSRLEGDRIDGTREMIGIGTANIATGFFQGFPVCSSSSRTAVARAVGSKTQLTGVVGSFMILLMLVAAPWLLKDLPQSVLAAVVIAASISLADIPATLRLYQQRPGEFWLSMIAFVGVILFGVLGGIAVAVGLSILNIFRRAWYPYMTVLGRVPDVAGYHDMTRYPTAEYLPGAVIFRFDAPLFFANSRTFREQVEDLAETEPPPKWIIIASEPITDVDTTAADMLEELDSDLAGQGIALVFAEMKDPVRGKLERYGLARRIEERHFFPTLTAAIKQFRSQHAVDWEGPDSDVLEVTYAEPGSRTAPAADDPTAPGRAPHGTRTGPPDRG
jgi:high affinity sulfate transporter 1